MPTYCFKRPDGVIVERFFPMKKGPPKSIRCDDGVEARHDFAASLAGRGGISHNGGEYAKPMYSDACGCHPADVPEMQRRFPHHEYAADGRMIWRNRAHRERCLRDLGWADRNG